MRERIILAVIIAVSVAIELAAHAEPVLAQLRWCPKCVVQTDPYRWR